MLHEEGTRLIAVPQVFRFNAEVARCGEFGTTHRINGVTVRTGLEKDAVLLKRGESAGIVTGDCPTIAFWNRATGEAAAAHAGRDSLLDRRMIEEGLPSRPRASVVESVLKYTRWNSRDVFLYVSAGIGPLHFAHSSSDPVHGNRNRKMIEWIERRYGAHCIRGKLEEGRIDLYALICLQAAELGIPSSQIQSDGLDTYTHQGLWSHRNAEKRAGRNIVLVSNIL